jgi:hypothetical protein
MLLTTILTTKLAAVIGSAVVALGSFSGVAYAANGAAPGDTLYGLDCALESVGLGDGGLEERLTEATRLCDRGEVERGLNHAAAAVQNQAGLESGQANGALTAAANAVQNAFQTANQGESDQIRARVAAMLQWMATTEAQGKEFGQGVSERAREIAGAAEQEPNQNQNQERNQNQRQNGEPEQNQSGEAKGGK